MGTAPVRDCVVAPFTGRELARALRWAKEWYTHEYRDSFQTAFAVFLLERAAWDFEQVDEGEVRRSVFTIGDVRRIVDATGTAKHPDTYKGVPADVAKSTKKFRHYYWIKQGGWYEFSFLGPGPAQRYPGRNPQQTGNYYLAVEYAPVSIGSVPDDRRHHRPGHLARVDPEISLARSARRSQIPAVTADVIGRWKDVHRILKKGFARRREKAVAVSLQGLPGVGKTEVVALLANAVRNRYRDGHIYLSAGSEDAPHSAEQVLRGCLRALEGDGVEHPGDTAVLAARYRTLLRDRACLIVCENVVSVEQIAELMPPAGSALVVTSRSHIVLPDGTQPIAISPLRANEARAFLERGVPRTAEAADRLLLGTGVASQGADIDTEATATISEVIARLAGCLPLALRICKRYLLNHPDVDPAAFAQAYLNEQFRLEITGARRETISVEACFNISYRALDPGEQRVFRALGIFPGSFSKRVADAVAVDGAVFERDPPHVIVSDLVQRGLVMWDAPTQRFVLHELVRAFAATRLGSAERATVLDQLVATYHAIAERQITAFRRGDEHEIKLADLELEHELPTIRAMWRMLLSAALESRDVLDACSDLVLGYAPLLLGGEPTLLRTWSETLADMFAPRVEKILRHPHLPIHTESRDLIASPFWGSAALRWMYHTYHVGLATEQLRTGVADDTAALLTYESIENRVNSTWMATDAACRSILTRVRVRKIRLLRRLDRTPRPVFDEIKRDSRAWSGRQDVEVLLDAIVDAQASAVEGDHARAREKASWMLTAKHDIPWDAAFYLDTLAEVPAAWQDVYLWNVKPPTTRRPGKSLTAYLAEADGKAPPELVSVIANFFDRAPRPTRAASPMLAGAVLAKVSPLEAARFFAAAVRVAEQLHDADGLSAALAARGVTNVTLGNHATGVLRDS
jgi:hypothetical protein